MTTAIWPATWLRTSSVELGRLAGHGSGDGPSDLLAEFTAPLAQSALARPALSMRIEIRMVFEAIQGGVQLPSVTARADGQQGEPARIPSSVRAESWRP